MAEEKNARQSERPPDSDFQQQNLKAWQPLLTPQWVIGTFAAIGLMFVPIGIIVLDASKHVVEVEKKYDEEKPPPLCVPPNVVNCCNDTTRFGCGVDVTIDITDDMTPPIFMYYKLTNFYQNHRRYVKSRSDAQLRGDSNPLPSLTSCEPLEEYNGKKLYPCGLIANSYFNDTFTNPVIVRAGTEIKLDWSQKGIAWDSDVKDKFKKLEPLPETWTNIGPSGRKLPEVTDEDFIVWMRTAGLPTFKKLRWKLDEKTKLLKGDKIKMTVDNTFPVSSFQGEKFIVLSTTSWLGGKNDFLGWAYIIVGSICILLAVVFVIKHITSPRPLGDMKYFNWSNGAQ